MSSARYRCDSWQDACSTARRSSNESASHGGNLSLRRSTAVLGKTKTNRHTASAFSHFYGEVESASGATNRPIMAGFASGLSINLPAGTCWLDWQVAGILVLALVVSRRQ